MIATLLDFPHVIERLNDPVQVPGKNDMLAFYCPLHESSRRKGRCWINPHFGCLLLGCWSCGTDPQNGRSHKRKEIMSALGLTWRDCMPKEDVRKWMAVPGSRTIYHYKDEDGNPLYRVVRTEWQDDSGKRSKTFSQQRLFRDTDHLKDMVDKKWIKDMADTRRVIYRLPEVLKAIHNQRHIYFVEGEKKADLLWEMGFPSTCIAGGSNAHWLSGFTHSLSGADILILPDNDEPGITYGERVFAKLLLSNRMKSVSLFQLPDLPHSGDICDWVSAQDGGELVKIAYKFELLTAKSIPYGSIMIPKR